MNEIGIKREDLLKYLTEMTEFERAVLMEVFNIPKGKVSTYKRIAERVGRPRAFRAVGNALHKNPLAPLIPCHRVVKSNGQIVGETIEEIETRRNLLIREGLHVEGYKVKLNNKMLY